MRVGVYTGDFPAEAGGGHSFVASVLGAFLEHARSSRHEFIVFCEPAHEHALAPRCSAAGVGLRALQSRSRFGDGIAVLRHYAPLAYLLRKWPGRLEAAARERGVQFLWFVPGIAYEAPDIPYLGTVWDLLHRLHPWFPEASADGYWEHRELVYARFVRRAAHLLTGTRVGADQLAFHFQVPSERISVLPQPAPLPREFPQVAPSTDVSALAGSGFFLYPAQFWPHKNHVNLLHAMKLLGGDAKLVLPGADKGNLAHVRQVAAGLGLEARVVFPGFVSTADLGWLYRHAIALVYPSFLGPDNLPPLEAFSLGCPVAMADYAGAGEQAGDAALRFDPRLPEQIATALRTLINDGDLRHELVRRGRERASRWTGEEYIRGVFALLDDFANVRRCWSPVRTESKSGS